jgi:hypothetical protein
MNSETFPALVPRRSTGRVGAVEEYAALHRAALDGLVRHGLEAAAATVRLRAEARRLVAVRGEGLDRWDEERDLTRDLGRDTGRNIGRDLGAGVHPGGGTGNGDGGGHRTAVVPFIAETEAAIAEVHDEYRQLTVHVLRMARYRLGLC